MQHAYIDEYSKIDSFIHRIEPRLKIVAFLAFILFVIFTPPEAKFAFTLYAMLLSALILLSRIPFSFVLKRSLVIVPFVLFVAIFIPFVKKGEVAGAYSLGQLRLSVTYDGLMIFWNVLIKSYLSILCMILLTSSTQFSDLLKGLERLKCPFLMVLILSFMYRYIFVVQDEMMKMRQAKAARSAGGSRLFHVRTLANMLGVLFIRTYERGEQVYSAMCGRGFSGKVRIINESRIELRDIIFLIAMTVILSGIRILAK